MTTAATAFTITADQMDLLGHQVSSSAMISWAVINNDDAPELLVLFRQGGTFYRYAFRSWTDASNWALELAGADAVSWGGALHRYLNSGALVPIAA